MNRPVFGIDVDGTLAQYHRHFLWFAAEYLGQEMPHFAVYDGRPFNKFMGISKVKYRQVKLAYRQSGLKRSIPAYPFAAELSRGLRKAGAEVVICSTRPYLHLSNIEPDLREWLKRNKVQYDDVILGEHKYRELRRGYGERVRAVLDDLPEMAVQASAVGLCAFLVDRPWNQPTTPTGIPGWESGLRVGDLEEAAAELEAML